jgi:hypothetical protein
MGGARHTAVNNSSRENKIAELVTHSLVRRRLRRLRLRSCTSRAARSGPRKAVRPTERDQNISRLGVDPLRRTALGPCRSRNL